MLKRLSKNNAALLILLALISWLGYDSYKQQFLVPKGSKLPSARFRSIDGITSQPLPKEKVFQIIFLFSPSTKESRWTAKSLNMVKSILPENFKIFSIAQNYKSTEEVLEFKQAALDVEAFFGYQKALDAYKVKELPMFYFVNPQGTITASTIGFTTPIGILIRAYFSSEDKEENKWYLKF